LNNPHTSAVYAGRMLFVILAMITGIGAKNLNLDTSQQPPSEVVRLLDLVRQLALVAVIFYGILTYTYAPVFR
jgi:hypothetical protein